MRSKPNPAEGAETRSAKIAKILSDRVVHGTYRPGERLIESALSREFGVSHGPIRDALRILEKVGLVTINSFRGAEVTEISVREVNDLYQVRAALVSIRAKWIAQDPDRDAILCAVNEHIARLDALADEDSTAESFVAESFAVNNLLTDSLTNRWLRSTIQALTLQTSRYSRLALLASRDHRRESAHLWQALSHAMMSGDGDLAEKVGAVLSLTARDAAIRYLTENGVK